MAKSSKYLGVSRFIRKTGCKGEILRSIEKSWTANLYDDNHKKYFLGYHETEHQAAIAYDKKVLELNIDRPLNILKRV